MRDRPDCQVSAARATRCFALVVVGTGQSRSVPDASCEPVFGVPLFSAPAKRLSARRSDACRIAPPTKQILLNRPCPPVGQRDHPCASAPLARAGFPVPARTCRKKDTFHAFPQTSALCAHHFRSRFAYLLQEPITQRHLARNTPPPCRIAAATAHFAKSASEMAGYAERMKENGNTTEPLHTTIFPVDRAAKKIRTSTREPQQRLRCPEREETT